MPMTKFAPRRTATWPRLFSLMMMLGILSTNSACDTPRQPYAEEYKNLYERGYEVRQDLNNRLTKADDALLTEVFDALVEKRAKREQVIALFQQGFEFFEDKNYYPARRYFERGLQAHENMKWPNDEVYAQARYYYGMIRKLYCESEPDICLYESVYTEAEAVKPINDRLYAYAYIELEMLVDFQYAARADISPPAIRAEAQRECRAALQRYSREIEISPGFLTSIYVLLLSHHALKTQDFGFTSLAPEAFKCD